MELLVILLKIKCIQAIKFHTKEKHGTFFESLLTSVMNSNEISDRTHRNQRVHVTSGVPMFSRLFRQGFVHVFVFVCFVKYFSFVMYSNII